MAAQGDLSGDRLEIRVKAARGLTKIAGTEPSCIVQLEYGMEKRATEMVSSLTPEWDKSKMYVFSNVAEQDVEYLVFKLIHKDMTTFKDVVIGILPVELSTVMNSPNITQDDWRVLRSAGDGGPEFPNVELRIQLTYMMDDIELGEDIEFDETQAKYKPNYLALTLEKGRNLVIENGRTGVDPEATITVLGSSKVTSCVRNDTSPRWNWKGGFNITEPDWAVEIVVKDRNRFGSPVLGRCRVTMTEILAEKPFKNWIKLLDDQYRFGPEGLGEVLLSAEFTYNKKARRSLFTSLPKFGRSSKTSSSDKRDQSLVAEAEQDRLIDEAEAAGDTADAAVAMFGEEREIWEREQAAAQALALKQQKQQAKRMEKVIPGDYQVSIHIIEARDLKPQDSSGTSDPFVFAKCSLGGTNKTATQKSNNSPLFDERLVFSYKDLTRQALHEATVTVCVYDEDWFGLSRQMIGSCSFDLLGVYTKNEQHEIYRSWVGLTDTEENNDEVGIQGFLKLSMSVLGPGDPIPVHDLEEELKLERARERDEPGAEGTMQWARERKLEYIAMSVFKAQELLTTPSLILSSRVYCRLEFAGNKINSHASLVSNATFNEQLWVPAYVPTMATRVVISMWKRGVAFGSDIPLGHHYLDFAKIRKCKRERDLLKDLKKEKQWKWVNLYGAAIKGVKQKGANAQLMNKFSDHASTYRGRLMINTRSVLRPPHDFNNVPVRKKLKITVSDAIQPTNAVYVLRAFLIQGCEIPEFKKLLPDLEEGTNIAKMKVKICIGANSIEWPYASNQKGMVVWNQLAEQKGISLPEDFKQIPDALIYLIRETDNAPVSFLRVPVIELLSENFSAQPKFFHLRPDRSRKAALGEAEYAGSVSIKLGFGREEVARQNQWSDFSEVADLSAYCLRVHVYQARGLPASDESGTLDPYVKVRFNGLRAKSSQKDKTCDPCWFESLEIDQNQLMLPEDPDFCPEIVVRIWDSDGMFSANTPVCGFHLPLKDVQKEMGGTSTVPEPKWMECFRCNDTAEIPAAEGNKKGELLVSFQLIPKRTRNEIVRPSIDQVSETLRPSYKLVWLDILAWGVRDLQGGSNPYVRFDIVGSDGKITSHKSKKSNRPNGRSANFLERIVTSIELPEDIIFTPMLNVRVYDNTYGGVSTDMVGSVSVDLVNKLPWSEDYMAPQTEEFETAAKIDKEKQKILDRRAKAKAGKPVESDDEEEGNDEEVKDDLGSDDEPEKPIDPSTLDSGLGAFDFTSLKTSANIWQLPEDVQSLVKKQKGNDNLIGGNDWWGGKEAEFEGEDPAVTNDLPDPRELGIDIPDSWASKEWLQDRDFWIQEGGSTLEEYLKTSPFENYILKKGCLKSNGASTVRVVGKFKGLISISDSKNAEPLVPLERVADYVARLYVWKAESLQPSDPNGKADPYLKVSMGGFSESGRKLHETATVNPDFYKMYEIPMKIPGESQLKISVFDWDRFHLPGSSDTMIGETVVDIEDRYFHKKWKSLGEYSEQKSLTGPPKPIEARDLYVSESSNSQGKIYLWLEILPAGEARMLKPLNFDRPPPLEVEVRIILWALSGYSCDESSQDYFVKTYLKGAPRKKKETDTHWRSKTGSAQWNWRHKHKIEVPLDMPDKGDLVVELWDRDIISANDSLGAFTFPLADWLKKCYIEQIPIKPFELINDKVSGKEDEKNKLALQTAAELEEEEENEGGEEGVELKAKAPPPPSSNPMHQPTLGGDETFDDDAFDVDEIQEPVGDGDEDEEEDSEEGEDDDENTALVKKDKKDEKKQKKPENVLDVLRELVGLPVSRDDAHWFDLGVMDVESGQYSTNGQLYITLELVPMEQAESSPVGLGRAEPNTSPYLPPPAGRLKIGLDPCSILCALFAEFPGIICCICCCCCAIILLAVMMVGSTYISAFSALGI